MTRGNERQRERGSNRFNFFLKEVDKIGLMRLSLSIYVKTALNLSTGIESESRLQVAKNSKQQTTNTNNKHKLK